MVTETVWLEFRERNRLYVLRTACTIRDSHVNKGYRVVPVVKIPQTQTPKDRSSIIDHRMIPGTKHIIIIIIIIYYWDFCRGIHVHVIISMDPP